MTDTRCQYFIQRVHQYIIKFKWGIRILAFVRLYIICVNFDKDEIKE